MKIQLTKEQERQLSSRDNIKDEINRSINSKDVVAFDIYDDDVLIGFAMLKKYEKGYFLWHYAIDYRFQNKGHGNKALVELFDFLKQQGAMEISTTYLWGNNIAKHVYEKVGFVETEVVNEGSVHEVNMVYKLKR